MCSKCEICICKKTMVRENPKPYRSGNVLIRELICCKNWCGYWNRDVNGSTNIYKIAYNLINNKERPNYLSRSKNSSTSLDELVNPKFTRSAKSKLFWFFISPKGSVLNLQECKIVVFPEPMFPSIERIWT